jgi:hypothetical protein
VREAFDETLSQLRGAVILRHAGETLSAGMVIGHIVVGTSTGMIVAENSCRYLILNFAAVGYDPIPIYSTSFNSSSLLWYEQFPLTPYLPRPGAIY